MNTIAELKLLPLWVDQNHLVSTAIHIMAGHKVKALGVLREGRLIGTVSLETLAAAPPEEFVDPFVHPLDYVVKGSSSIRSVAAMFVENQLDYAPVLDGERFMGIVTPLNLLRELGRSYDPLTGLSWSDRLREWGLENLKQGREVTILFIDLDDFGHYNKKFGHIVGDRILQRLATYLTEGIEPATDILVRYGGDEFAIGTLRHRNDAEDLAERIEAGLAGVNITDTDAPISFSVGLYGGRRSRERENTHFAATLDNLINMASRECMAAKAAKQKRKAAEQNGALAVAEVEDVTPEVTPKFSVAGVYFDERATNGVTTVILTDGTSVVSGAHSRAGKPALESISIATAKAVERAYPGTPISLEDIHLVESGENRLVSVSLRVGDQALSGVYVLQDDLYEAAAAATLAALASLMAAPAA